MTDVPVADSDEYLGLPGWVYSNSGFFCRRAGTGPCPWPGRWFAIE
jgi:hypothetical protein